MVAHHEADPPEGDPPFLSEEQLRHAVKALGITDESDTSRSRAYLLGALLALVETACYHDLDRVDLPVAHDGYLGALLALSGEDPQACARAWALVLNDRLNRTAVDLNDATDGSGRMFIEVAGPAMLAAANLLNVLNHTGLTEQVMRDTIAYADGNLKTARRNLGQLRETLRRQGFQL